LKHALVVYSGGKPFAFEQEFLREGFGLRAVASHRIEFTPETFPFGRPVDRAIFTSRNSVVAVSRAGLPLVEGARVHAVGPSTWEALMRQGVLPEVPPASPSAGALLADLPARLEGEFIFWPRGDDSEPALADELRRRGAEVYAPVVYRKVPLEFPADLAAGVRTGEFAAFACTSGAAARWLYANLDPAERTILNLLPSAVLGPATEMELRSLGAERITVSPEATFESLAGTLLELMA
jgi:uroporphyrinogen-III synthase